MSGYVELVYCVNCEEFFDGSEYDGSMPDGACGNCGERDAWDVRRYDEDELVRHDADADDANDSDDEDVCPECGAEAYDDADDDSVLACDACGWEA